MNSYSALLAKKNMLESSWKAGYVYFSRVISRYGLRVGVEIGVSFGGHAEAILASTSVTKLYGVDPYKHIDGYNDICNFPQKEFNSLYRFATKRLSIFQERYVSVRKFSKEAAGSVPNNLDFVYIDGDHSYGGVEADLNSWFVKVRDGGIIGGHDYAHPNHPGVKKAIDIFFRRFRWKINIEKEGIWWIEKKPINISFVIPAYNSQKTLSEAVKSIYKGNFTKGDEMIVVDDASTDNTFNVIKSLKKKYPSIRLYRHNYNKGSAAAGRNTAIEHSRNELIFCLDADNVLAPKSVPKLKEYMIRSNADVAAFKELRYFSKKINNVSHTWTFPDVARLQDCFSTYKFPGASGNYLFTKESWIRAGRYNESVGGACDSWAFGFCQLATGSKMVTMPDSYYYHRYGYQSSYIRDSKAKNISLTILQIIMPFIDLFEDSGVEYIMSKKWRRIWFDKLESHPIRLKQKLSTRFLIKTRVYKYLFRLKTRLSLL